jgi:hypothetical protein
VDAKVDDAIDNKLTKAVVRVVVFVMPLLFAVMSGVGTWFLNDIRATGKTNETEVKQMRTDLNVLKATVDAGVVWRITEIERRLNTVEQVQKTP